MTGLTPASGSVTIGTTVVPLNSASTAFAGLTSLTGSNAAAWQLPSGAASATNPTILPNRASSTTGIGAQASGNISFIAGGAEIARVVSGGLTVISGKALTLGNAATTGLAAGVLAAITNASIVVTDSTGQAYRIPCTI